MVDDQGNVIQSTLLDLFANHTSLMRLNYYPHIDSPTTNTNSLPSLQIPMGVSRHTDAGGFTVLLQDSVPGLEVYSGSKEDNNDGEWISVPPVINGLTINIGDMLQVGV